MTWIYDYLILKDKYFKPKEKYEYKLTQSGIDEGMTIEDARLKTKRTMLRLYFEKIQKNGVQIKDLL